MIRAVLAGVCVALLLQISQASVAELMYDCCRDSNGGLPIWYALFSSPFGALVALLPGLIAGWLSVSRGIVAGLLAGLLGNAVYSSIFLTMWPAVLEGGASAVLQTVVQSVAFASSWALIAAAGGGTAQLMRSNKVLQSDVRNARA